MKSAAATAALYRFISLRAVHWHAAVISAHCFEKSRHTLLVFRSKVVGNQRHHAQTNTNTDIERQSLHLQLDPDSCQIDIAMRRCKHIAGSSRDTDAEDRSQLFLCLYMSISRCTSTFPFLHLCRLVVQHIRMPDFFACQSIPGVYLCTSPHTWRSFPHPFAPCRCAALAFFFPSLARCSPCMVYYMMSSCEREPQGD